MEGSPPLMAPGSRIILRLAEPDPNLIAIISFVVPWPGLAKPGLAWPGQARPGKARPGQAKTDLASTSFITYFIFVLFESLELLMSIGVEKLCACGARR